MGSSVRLTFASFVGPASCGVNVLSVCLLLLDLTNTRNVLMHRQVLRDFVFYFIFLSL